MEISSNALTILRERYFLKNCSGMLVENSWDQVCKRVSECVGQNPEQSEHGSFPGAHRRYIQQIGHHTLRWPGPSQWCEYHNL